MSLYKKNQKKKIILFGNGTHLKITHELARLNGFKIEGLICDGSEQKKKNIQNTKIRK